MMNYRALRKASYLLIPLWFTVLFEYAEAMPLKITDVYLSQKTIQTDRNESVEIHYTLSKDAEATIKIFNRSDLLVRTLAEDISAKAGQNIIKWDGSNDFGELLPDGAYIYTIQARAGEDLITYDPADETGGFLIKIRKPSLDTQRGEISYIMPRAGMVRIRAGIKEGAHLRTLVDWEPREGGRIVEPWDGKDKSGLINLFNIPDMEVFVFAYSLPDNAILIHGRGPTSSKRAAFSSPGIPQYRPKANVDESAKYRHALEDPEISSEPEFDVLFPGNFPTTSSGAPILNGTVPVKIVISEKDRQRLESSRFEVMFFVDTVFLFEDEEGFSPFTYKWDTSGLSEGFHILTVNIMSYDGHCGVESKKVKISNKPMALNQ